MQIFTKLSQNQQEALGKTCKVCGKGIYVERNGRYGPWVQCNAWPCKAKVYRPRGAWVSRGEVATGAQVKEQQQQIFPQVSANDLVKDTVAQLSEVITAKVIVRVTEKTDATLAQVETNANAVLSIITDALAELRANKPVVLEVKQANGNVAKVENGHYLLPRLIKLMGAGFNVFPWGPAGSGKTTACQMAAKALGWDSEFDTLDPTTFRSMMQGYMTPQGQPVHTTLTRCVTEGKVYIGEEIDNAPGHVQTLCNTGLANGHWPFAWGNVVKHDNFRFVCNGNTPGRPTREFPDRKPMSAAFMDRLYFMYWPLDPAIECRAAGLPIPARSEPEAKTCSAKEWVTFVRNVREWGIKNAPTLMVTPRASLLGIQALALGESPLDVAHGLIFRGADSELVAKVLNAVKLP